MPVEVLTWPLPAGLRPDEDGLEKGDEEGDEDTCSRCRPVVALEGAEAPPEPPPELSAP